MKRIDKYTFAKQLRHNQTDAEKLLWIRLRNNQINGIKFRRQQVIGPYIVDFVSFEKKLIIELDGGQHNTELGRGKDKTRTDWLKNQGFTVLRFWNNDLLNNIDEALEMITLTLTLSNRWRGKR